MAQDLDEWKWGVKLFVALLIAYYVIFGMLRWWLDSH